MKSIAVRTLLALAVVLISGLSPGIAAIDDVIVWNGVRTQAQIEDTLQHGYDARSGAVDDVIMWSTCHTKEQVEDTLVNGYDAYPQLSGAIDDVVVWDKVLTKAEIEDRLVNGHTSTANMTFWWKFNTPSDLIYDTISGGTKGVVKGSPISLTTATPNDASNLAAGGFTSVNNWLVANVGRGIYWQDTTYQLWIRNPRKQTGQKAVFFSLTSNENGGGDADDKRMWVNPDGSISIGEYSTNLGHRVTTSAPLTWEDDAWYQITLTIHGYDGRDGVPPDYVFQEDCKIYRGKKGDTTVQTVLNYIGDWPQYPGNGYPYLSVGAHPQGYYSGDSGSPGYLGGNPDMAFRWSFNRSSDLIYDECAEASKGVIKGAPVSLSTATPNDTSNLAAGGFTSVNNWLVANVGRGSYWQDTTYEMWIRDPLMQTGQKAVFFSLTSNEDGGGDSDDKRMWVNPDGSISIGEYSTNLWHRVTTSAPLTWERGKWYQIALTIHGYDGRDGVPPDYVYQEDVKIYRGKKGDTTVQTVLDYIGDWPQYPGNGYPYLSVGAHPQGYYSGDSGSPGFLGGGGAAGMQMWWSFDDSGNMVRDEVSQTTKGEIMGAPTSVATSTPFDTTGRAATGFNSMDDWIVGNTGLGWPNDRTFEMWIRNPQISTTPSIFWGLHNTKEGGDVQDRKILWVDLQGRLCAYDWGYYTRQQTIKSQPLEWEEDKWYQITLTYDDYWYDTPPGMNRYYHLCTVYRGVQGESTVQQVLQYYGSEYGSDSWMSVGGHQGSYYFSGGYFGNDEWMPANPEDPVMSPPAGSMTAPTPVTITCPTVGATIRYTTNGEEPNEYTSPQYTSPITATDNMTIKAKAFKSGGASNTASAYYYIPDPLTIDYSTSIVVDGNLSEWNPSDFVSIDRLYWVPPGYPEPGYEISITEAKYAAKWKGDKVYVAVKVNDPTHVLVDNYSDWDLQDDIEVYLKVPGSTGPIDYSSLQQAAQQFIMGIKENKTDSWAMMGGHTSADGTTVGLTRAVSVSGTWLYYEVAMSPWQYFGGLKDPVEANVPCTLKNGDYIGLDVNVFDRLSVWDYAGMLSENELTGKSGNYNNIVLHKLVGGVSYQQMSIANAKNAAAGTQVEINSGAVSQAFTDYFYIETADRSSGIRVNKTAHGRSKSDLITKVTGEIKIDSATGEKYIQAVDALASGTHVIQPFGGSNRGLAGTGLETVGILVKAWGKITSLGGGIYSIDDGSGLDLRFQVVSGSFTVDPAKTYAVTGPMSLYKVQPSGPVVKLIIVKDAATDIRQF